jgi:hypothetical protein
MNRKALYRHKRTGDLFAFETDEAGKAINNFGGEVPKVYEPIAAD